MEQDYRHPPTTVSLIPYHFVFYPRYRRKVLVRQAEIRFKVLINEICQEHDWLMVATKTMPDHVHIFLHCLPTDCPSAIMVTLKGTTSRSGISAFALSPQSMDAFFFCAYGRKRLQRDHQRLWGSAEETGVMSCEEKLHTVIHFSIAFACSTV